MCHPRWSVIFFFFFNDTATTEIYTLSLHDALPISSTSRTKTNFAPTPPSRSSRSVPLIRARGRADGRDRKSTRLNSSHLVISYAVFCLKKKKHKHTSSIHTRLQLAPDGRARSHVAA